MKQIGKMMLGVALAAPLIIGCWTQGASAADSFVAARAGVQAPLSAVTEFSAQRRTHRRAPTRVRVHPRYQPDDVYPRYNPGPNAVRDCTATYVQEFRPSGTVIVPRMHCFWRQG